MPDFCTWDDVVVIPWFVVLYIPYAILFVMLSHAKYCTRLNSSESHCTPINDGQCWNAGSHVISEPAIA